MIVDQEEKNKERLIDIMGAKGVPVQVRKLPAGDYLWILLPENHDDQDNEPRPEEELVCSNTDFHMFHKLLDVPKKQTVQIKSSVTQQAVAKNLRLP